MYDHYKETFEIIQTKIKKRDKLFVLTFIISLFQLILASIPETLYVIDSFINNQYNINITNYFWVIHIFIWILQDYTYLRYSQTCVDIERKYNYIHSLEHRISNSIGARFDRESKDYLNNYPLISKVTNMLYRYFSAFALLAFSSVKIYQDVSSASPLHVKIFDFLLFVLYLIILFLHSLFVYKNDKKRTVAANHQ